MADHPVDVKTMPSQELKFINPGRQFLSAWEEVFQWSCSDLFSTIALAHGNLRIEHRRVIKIQ
jgi:hypothetical protein